jgi:hypothetical protein
LQEIADIFSDEPVFLLIQASEHRMLDRDNRRQTESESPYSVASSYLLRIIVYLMKIKKHRKNYQGGSSATALIESPS